MNKSGTDSKNCFVPDFLRQDHCIYLRSDFVENIAPVKKQNIQFQPISGA